MRKNHPVQHSTSYLQDLGTFVFSPPTQTFFNPDLTADSDLSSADCWCLANSLQGSGWEILSSVCE